MQAATFSCDTCGLDHAPTPCSCPDVDADCSDCGSTGPFVEVAPGIWICPGCVDMHRRRAA